MAEVSILPAEKPFCRSVITTITKMFINEKTFIDLFCKFLSKQNPNKQFFHIFSLIIPIKYWYFRKVKSYYPFYHYLTQGIFVP